MNDLIPLSSAIAEERIERQEEIDRITTWGQVTGRRIDPDLLALVLRAAHGWEATDPVAPWTRRSVHDLVRIHVPNWCSFNRCLWPEGVPETLWQWLHFLDATGGFGGNDERLHDLLKPLLCYGGLGFDGRQRPPGGPLIIECECFEPPWPGEEHDHPYLPSDDPWVGHGRRTAF